MIEDISTVLNPSYHVSQSLVILEEIIRVALVSVVFLLNVARMTKLTKSVWYSTCCLLLELLYKLLSFWADSFAVCDVGA